MLSLWSRIYYKLLSFPLSILVKSRSIPIDPSLELGLNISCPIIYVLPYSSKADLLTLRTQCLKHKLPDPLEPLVINDMVLPRYVFIHDNLHIPTCFTSKKRLIKVFYDYCSLHRNNPNLDVKVVPVSVMFGRHPHSQKNKVNLLLRIFDSIKKVFIVTWLGRDSFVLFSPSVSSRWIVTRWMATKLNTDDSIEKRLVRVARMHFTRQYLTTVGPRLLSRRDLLNKLLVSKTIIRAIEDEARSKKISFNKAKKNTVALIEEIAANLSYEMIRFTDRILRFTWNRLYQKINVNNVERVRQLAFNGCEIVYIPCHRSHMDYLLLSYVLYHHGLVPPHIAAGLNLNFWPTGPILRRLGAFFIRRTFKGNKLYSTVFREYLSELFSCGYSVEYFLEGGRSRTGRLLSPKTGTLSMTIQAMLRGRTRPIALVPIYIGYEHVIEVSSYTQELFGTTKEKESLTQMLRGLINLRNLGQSYINFGEPLSLTTWLNQHVPNWQESINQIESVRPTWLTPTVNSIAIDLMVRINNAGATNAMNLCCTALLASHHHSLSIEQLTEQLDCYLNLIRNVPYSADSTVPSMSAIALIEHALKMNKFEIKKKNTVENIIVLSCKQAALLTYYRNNISHMLVIPSLIAAIVTHHQCIHYQDLKRYVDTFYPMLKTELFLRWNRYDLTIELVKLINELLRQRLVVMKHDVLHINPSRLRTLQLLAAGVRETLQRYTITFWLLNMNPSIKRSILEKKSRLLAQKVSILHGINAPEFFDRTIFSTLVTTLCNEGYVNDDTRNIQQKGVTEVYRMLAELITPDVRLTIENDSD